MTSAGECPGMYAEKGGAKSSPKKLADSNRPLSHTNRPNDCKRYPLCKQTSLSISTLFDDDDFL